MARPVPKRSVDSEGKSEVANARSRAVLEKVCVIMIRRKERGGGGLDWTDVVFTLFVGCGTGEGSL